MTIRPEQTRNPDNIMDEPIEPSRGARGEEKTAWTKGSTEER